MRDLSYLLIIGLTVHFASCRKKVENEKESFEPLLIAPAPLKEQSLDVNIEDYVRHKDQICTSIPMLMSPDRVNLTLEGQLTEDGVYELMLTNIMYDLTSDSVLPFLSEELEWKKQVLDLLATITANTCKANIVSPQFLNVAKNLFLYFTHKNYVGKKMAIVDPITGEQIKEKPQDQLWDEVVDMLTQCANAIRPLSITSSCGKATYVDVGGYDTFIESPEEKYDLDMRDLKGQQGYGEEVIDAVWLMFSTTYARCFSFKQPHTRILIDFLKEFIKEFLEPMVHRWTSPPTGFNDFYPMIMGIPNLPKWSQNIRACATAAYLYEGIAQRELVRPLMVQMDGNFVENFKTGKKL